MVDILRTGVSGLLAFQRGLATTSQNIANAATEGYSRQRIELGAREPEPFGSGFIGRGVDITTVRRLFDQFAVAQLRSSSSELGRLSQFAGLAGRVDDILADPDGGIGATLQGFFAAWQDVASNPSSTTSRQLLLAQAQTLSTRFRDTLARLDQVESDANGGVRASLDEINAISSSLAQLNQDIQTARGIAGGQPPNDLLDERDRLLGRLAELVNVQTVEGNDGALNVFIGNGQTLVLGNFSAQLVTASNPLDASRVDVLYRGNGGADQVITSFITGGQLGGLLQVRTEVLDPARQQLGLVATVLADAINSQQAAGMDLNGQLGAALFAVAPPRVLGATSNTGSATASALVTDAGALTGDDYTLRFDGSSWSATRDSTGASVPLTGSGTAVDPFVIEGLAVTIGAGALAGDRFSLRGTRDAASSLRAVLTDPRGIAAAAPIRSAALSTNLGSGAITAGTVVDPANASLLAPVDIQFLTATTYSINGAGSFAYTPGSDIVVNGWQVQISGAPSAGDTFTVRSNAGSPGDNRNALLAAGLQASRIMQNGTTALGDGIISLIGRVGTLAAQADVQLTAQTTIQANARDAVLAQSGVNLDEEAADLLKWQRAYQAAAQTITVADTLFQTLLAATQR